MMFFFLCSVDLGTDSLIDCFFFHSSGFVLRFSLDATSRGLRCYWSSAIG